MELRPTKKTSAKGEKQWRCPLCGAPLGKRAQGIAKHFKSEHPEYQFLRGTSRSGGSTYRCSICNKRLSSFKDIVRHYDNEHFASPPQSQVVSQDNRPYEGQTFPDEDPPHSLLAIADLITGLNNLVKHLCEERDTLKKDLDEVRQKYKETLKTKIQLSASLVEAQELLAREKQR